MTERLRLGIQAARDQLRTLIDRALESGDITVIQRYGRPVAAVVPYAWLERAEAALALQAEAGETDDG